MTYEKDINKLSKELSNDYEVVNSVLKLYNEYKALSYDQLTPDLLGKYDNDFSVMKVSLGIAVAKTKYEWMRFKAERKNLKLNKYKEYSIKEKKVTHAKELAELSVESERIKEIELEYMYNVLQNFYDDIQNLLNSIGRKRKELLADLANTAKHNS